MAYGDMTHKGCGGPIRFSRTLPGYTYEHDNGTYEPVAALECEKCGVEVFGDPDIVLDEGLKVQRKRRA